MNQRTCLAFAIAGVAAAAAFAAPVWAGSGPDNLIALTMRVTEHMQGGPSIPPHTLKHTVCDKAHGKFDPADLSRLQRATKMCKTVQYARNGDSVTFEQECRMPRQTITTHGVFHMGPGANFTGTTTSAFGAAGRAITTEIQYTGQRVGSCTYTPPTSG